MKSGKHNMKGWSEPALLLYLCLFHA